MKYYSLPLQPMQESGAYLLRAMQNEEMPRLDLLVRESIQNALDAGGIENPSTSLHVDINLRECSTYEVASVLGEGINLSALHDRYANKSVQLEIRDSMTEGLTGPLTFSSVEDDAPHGNLLKLVFEIGRTRRDNAAGGSWGLGKTCYFRMGAGLVIYYSRIRSQDGFEERLVASLVEDENKPDRLLHSSRTGIAWWGAEEELRPITSSKEIHSVIKKLGIIPFLGEETGTSIIIPFLRSDLIPPFDKADGARPWWYENYESYIRVSLQRWFCARLDNPYFVGGPYLTARVNGKTLSRLDMLPVFRATQSLYNRVATENPVHNDFFIQHNVKPSNLILKKVSLRNEFFDGGSAGQLVAVLLTDEQLSMNAPHNNPRPSLCVFGRSEQSTPHRPIVTFMRKPGMSICWQDSIDSRSWTGGFQGSLDGLHMIALFVPTAERVLRSSNSSDKNKPEENLEGYLRSCERADHSDWVDISGKRIVEKIRTACGKFLRDFGQSPPASLSVRPSIRMARNLADLLLPARGFGGDGRSGKSVSTSEKNNKKSVGSRVPSLAPQIDVGDIQYVEDGLSISWSLVWGLEKKELPREMYIEVDSESGPISANSWIKSDMGRFPFYISESNLDIQGQTKIILEETLNEGANRLIIHANSPEQLPLLKGRLIIKFAAGVGKTLRPILSARILNDVEAKYE